MAYDGTLKFDTKMDTSGFQKGANNLTGLIKGLGVFEVLKKGVAMVTAQVDSALRRIDTMAQFSRVVTTMTGSVTTAKKALADTTKVVTGTAYGLDVAAKAVQSFISRGMSVSKSTQTISNFADAVSFYGDGTNASLTSVTEALGKMQTKGNVTMEHLEMLFNAGIPAVEIYAQATGQASSDVTAAMSKGMLSTESFINVMNTAFETGTTGFPSVAGAAKEAGASWAGTMDNMKAAITRGVQSIIVAFEDGTEAAGMPGAKDAIKSFGQTVETALKTMDSMKESVKTGGANVVLAIKNVKDELHDGFLPVVSDLRGIAYNMMDGIAVAMDNRAEGLYSKARTIALNIAAVMKDALDINSPSRVMKKLFGFVMDGAYEGLESGEDSIYRKAETISNMLASKLAIEQQVVPEMYAKLHLLTQVSPVNLAAVGGYGNVSGSTVNKYYNIEMEQNNTSPEALSPSEMTRQQEAFVRNLKWKL